MKKLKVLICDDHQIIVDGLKSLVNSIEDFEVVATANNGEEVLKVLKVLSVDIILMDIDMPIMNGLNATTLIKENYNSIKVVILSVHSEQGMIKSLIDLGVDGYLLKNSSRDELETAIRQVCSGKEYFSSGVTQSLLKKNNERFKNTSVDITRREVEILKLIASGLTNKEIGEKLFISHRTVDTHRTNLMRKIDVKNIAGLISFALKQGFVD